MPTVAIASTNLAKITAVKDAFARVFPTEEFEYKALASASEVSDQPMSREETLLGATNRIKNLKAQTRADFYVAMEGGVEYEGENMFGIGYAVVENNNHQTSARTATFPLPPKISKLLQQGLELAQADDIVFKRTDGRNQNGTVGILTNNIYTRSMIFQEAICMCLIPTINQELFELTS